MHDDNEGLARDLETLTRSALKRRNVLKWALGASLLPLVGCSSDGSDGAGEDGGETGGTSGTGGGSNGTGGMSTGGSSTGGATADSCSAIPEETAGPYPGDGSNGANALVLAGIVRSDITTSFAGATGVADGVPLTIRLTLVDASNGCEPLEGFAIYLWHCDAGGNYSMYSQGVTGENYLRGVQETDVDGVVEFESIFPACYSGRWPHVHFEMYPSLDDISSASNKVATSQLALPKADCDVVYATTGYEASVRNLSQISLTTDNVFSDGTSLQVASVTGNVDDGYVATLTVAIRT